MRGRDPKIVVFTTHAVVGRAITEALDHANAHSVEVIAETRPEADAPLFMGSDAVACAFVSDDFEPAEAERILKSLRNGSDETSACPVVAVRGDAPGRAAGILNRVAHEALAWPGLNADGVRRAMEEARDRWQLDKRLRERERALAEAESRYRQLAEAMPHLVWTANTDGIPDYYSPRAEEYSGLIKRPDGTWAWEPVVHEDDLQLTIDAWQHALETGEVYEAEHRIRMASGEFRWHLSRAVPAYDREGRIVKWHGTATDIHATRMAQEGVAESERRLRRVLNNLFVFVGELSPEGIVLTVNRAPLEAAGVREDEVVGHMFCECKLWRSSSRIATLIRQSIDRAAAGETVRFDIDMAVPGRRITVDLQIAPMIDADGVIRSLIASGVDVTDREQARTTLKASEERFRTIVRQSPFPIIVHTAEQILELSERVTELTGWTHEDVPTSTDWFRLVRRVPDSEIDEVVREVLTHKFSSDTGVEAEEVIWTKSGEPRTWLFRGAKLPGAHHGQNVYVSVALDITERKRIEASLALTESRFRTLADTAPVGIFRCDPDGALVFVNPSWCRLTGLSPETAKGSGWQRAMHPDDASGTLRGWREAVDRHEDFEAEFRFLAADGTVRWVLGRLTPEFDDAGQLIGFIGTVTDISERRNAEIERQMLLDAERAARSEAERQSRLKEEFLATLSHELRTPLSSIIGWSEYLQIGERTREELMEGIMVIDRNARTQSQLIGDLLDMSRLASGKVRLEIRSVNLDRICAEVLESFRHAAQARSISLACRSEDGVVPVLGDPSRIQQVISNLISNAIKFTPEGGRVEVHIRPLDRHVEIAVRDTGQGINPAFLPHVFDRFRQADGSVGRSHAGLGLGLAIVRQLVELHHGRVWAESPGEGKGSTFHLEFPIPIMDPFSAEAGSGVGGPEEWTFEGLQLLVVDDEPDVRELVRRLLEERGATVETAGTAQEALNRLDANNYDLMVSDIGLPGEDGYTMMRTIREREGDKRNIPAIALTAFGRPEDRARALICGYQIYLVKPIDSNELLASVFQLSRWARARG